MVHKNIIALGFVSFFTDMASSMISSILPIFIVYILDNGIDKLGFIIAFATFVSYSFRIVFGYLSDKHQIVKPFVLSGYLISAITKPLLYFTNSWQSIGTLRGIERMGKAIRSASKDSLISSYNNGQSGKAFGFHKMMDVGGEMTGAIIAFLMLFFLGQHENVFRNIFALSLIPGILSVLIMIFFVKDSPHSTKKKKKEKFQLGNDKKLMPLLFIYFSFVFFMFNDSFFIIKAKEKGVPIKYIPLFIMLLTLTQTLISYYSGLKIDRHGAKKILSFSFLFGILAMLALSFNFIILSFILLGIFLVTSFNSLRAYVSDHANKKATIFGFLYAGMALFGALGAIILGLVWKTFNAETSINVSLLGLLTTFGFYLIIEKRKTFR